MFFRDTSQQDVSHALGFLMAVVDGSKFCCLKAEGGWFSRDEYQCFKSTDLAAIEHWLTEQHNNKRNVFVLLHKARRFLDFVRPVSHELEGTKFLAYRFFERSPAEICEVFSPAPTVVLSAKSGNYAVYALARSWDMRRHALVIKDRAAYMRDEAEPTDWLPLPFLGATMSVAWDPGNIHDQRVFSQEKDHEREREMALSMYAPVVRSTPAMPTGEYRSNPINEIGMDGDDELEFESMENVTAKPIEWLWEQKFAIGKLNLLGGMPGQGKSQVTISLAAAVSRGGLLPDGRRAPAGKVLLLVSEDDAGDTIKPRLEAAGADMRNVFIVRANFSIGADFAKFKALIEKIGDVRLVVFDPVVRYVDAGANQTVRKSLDRVIDWAQSKRICLLGILHPPKGEKITNVQSLFGGSSAFVQLCRGAWMCLPSGEDGLFYFLFAKGNIYSEEGKRDGKSYHIEGFRTQSGIKTSRIVWTQDHIDMTADDALMQGIGQNSARKEQPKPKQEGNGDADGPAVERAKKFLREELQSGPKEVALLREMAAGDGIYPTPLYAAKKAMGLREAGVEGGINNGRVWMLPH